MVVFGQSGCIWAKVVVFGQKLFYIWVLRMSSGENGCIPARWLYSGKNCSIQAKLVKFGQKWLYSGIVVVFGQKWLYSGKSGCNRAKMVLFG